jgi:tetratricopeptide (TPR) repeat protein
MRKEERHQIKRNDLATAMESAADYVGENRRSVTMMAAVAVGVLLLGFAGRSWWSARQGEGARRVGDLITAANASIIATVDDLGSNRGGGPTFTSTEERSKKVVELADEILKKGGPGSATLTAQLYKGSALADLGKADEAAAVLEAVVKDDPQGLLGGSARLRLARLREAQGRPADALTLYQQIASDASGIMPPEEGLLGAARCQEALGQKDAAAQSYKSLLDKYPDSEYAAEARNKTGASS